MALKLTDYIPFLSQPKAIAQAIQESELDLPKGKPPQEDYKDLPVMIYGSWSVGGIQSALLAAQNGQFAEAAKLTESVLGDDSVGTALNGRIKGVTMRHVHAVPADGDTGGKYAKIALRAWRKIFTHELMDQLMTWSTMMGFVLCEIVWDACDVDGETLWVPRLKIWHPQFVYYDIVRRAYVAITEDSGVIYTDEDPSKWWLWAPWGQYRGWIRGALRGIAPLWMVRQYAVRDWARFSEVHGLPTKVVKAPYSSSASDKARMFASVRGMGANTTVMLPQQAGPDGMGWAIELLEAKDRAWEAFPGLADYCDRRIHLAIRGTNLTSEVQGGSYAAAQVHADEDSAYADSDCAKLCEAARSLFEMFLGYNFGAADLCPEFYLESPDKQDKYQQAQTQQIIVDIAAKARALGWVLDEKLLAENYHIPLTKVEEPPKPAQGGTGTADQEDTDGA